jgi:hypothetical protein
MKKIMHKLLTGISISLLICFLAACQDLTGPQGEPGTDGRDAVLPPDIKETLSAALAAKTGGDTEPWAVKVSGLDLSDTYIARYIFHTVAADIPEGPIELDLSECTGEFFSYNAGISLKDKTRYTGLTLPASLTSISDGRKDTTSHAFGAFTDFASLKSIRAAGLLRVGDYAFFGCTVLEILDFPNVTNIGEYAFAPNSSLSTGTQYTNNTVLTRVDLPSVQTIGRYAFYRCLAIADLILPEVRSIGQSAFSGFSDAPNTVLETVDLPRAESLGISVFRYCNAISTIRLPMAQEILGYAFGADDGDRSSPNTVLRQVELPEAGTLAAVFENCTALEEARLPAAASIGTSTFKGCTSLTTVYAPELISVGDNVFEGCTSLASLYLPSARSVGASAFKSCTALTTLNAPEITDVGHKAFDGCIALASLELTQVRSIGKAAFANCTALVSLTLGPDVPTTIGTTAADGIFLNTNGGTAISIYVPAASQSTYASADWQQFNASETGWVNTTANGSPITWGTNHKEIKIETY